MFKDENVIGPVLPPVTYSDDESIEEDENESITNKENDYEPPPYKQMRVIKEDSDSESDDYVDPAVVARDPALASVL